MQATITKWGNSLALRLPRHVAEEVRVVEGATVELDVADGTIVIRPARKRFILSELLEPAPAEARAETREETWGGPAGNEAW
ncbi:MAG: AbrB/MazE/SpoVT family DNA-binding domain-containing protein [Bauldia sp.]